MGYSVPLANFARVFFALLSKFVLVDGELSEGSLAICPGLWWAVEGVARYFSKRRARFRFKIN